MMKTTMLAMFGLLFAMVLMAPAKANAQVVVGVRPVAGVAFGVTVAPAPYVVAPAPYAVYGPGYVYPAPGVVVGYRPYPYRYGYYDGWRGGYYRGYVGHGYYGHGYYGRGWRR